jgi:cytochrome c oxidase cbb3-type subunit I/II
MKSYSVYAGVQDALVQCGMVTTRIFSTTPFRLMYYFVPKAANRPVYFDYQLYFGPDFIYIWLVGPHHLYILLY